MVAYAFFFGFGTCTQVVRPPAAEGAGKISRFSRGWETSAKSPLKCACFYLNFTGVPVLAHFLTLYRVILQYVLNMYALQTMMRKLRVSKHIQYVVVPGTKSSSIYILHVMYHTCKPLYIYYIMKFGATENAALFGNAALLVLCAAAYKQNMKAYWKLALSRPFLQKHCKLFVR